MVKPSSVPKTVGSMLSGLRDSISVGEDVAFSDSSSVGAAVPLLVLATVISETLLLGAIEASEGSNVDDNVGTV